jgi:hypothetical protein
MKNQRYSALLLTFVVGTAVGLQPIDADAAEMNADGKSDGFVVPAKPANKDATEASAESAEERDPAKRNAQEAVLSRTQRRNHGR